MSFHHRLKRETETERSYLMAAPAIEDCRQGIVPRRRYLAFLTQAYYHVRHTVPLLMAAGARLHASHPWLFDAVIAYIDEEKGHDEWILSDIAACGGDVEAVRNGQPAFATELMVAYAYDTVQRGNPVGFFGMVHVLEHTSAQLATPMAGLIQQSLGLPPAALTYLTSHGALDQAHVAFFADLMDRLDDARDQAAVVHMARRMYRLYGDMFRSLTDAETDRGGPV